MFIISLIFLSLFSANFSKIVEIECPPHCKCDIFETFRRATCQNRNLVVFESDIPPQTQLLDLSFNQISKLGDHIFSEQDLLSLKLLNISHNKLSQIHMNAFEGMNSLKTLDLSYNIIQYILINWFWSLTSLEELYLRGNGLSTLHDGPLLESKTLKVLDLSACAITFVNNDSFIKLPNLEVINLSENYLQQIDSTAIRPLANLRVLNVESNSMECTSVTEKLAAYCTQKGIGFANPCAIKHLDSDKMERMVAAEAPPDEKNSWIYDDEVATSVPVFGESCDNSTATEVQTAGLLMKIIGLSPTLSILITLVYGIMIGLVIGCTVQIKCKSNKRSTQQTSGRTLTYKSYDIFNTIERNRHMDEDFEDMLITNELIDLSGTTPVAQRKFTPDNNNG